MIPCDSPVDGVSSPVQTQVVKPAITRMRSSASWTTFVYRCFRTAASVLAVVIVLAGYVLPVLAEEPSSEAPFSDKLMIRGGWAYVFGATANVSVAGPVLGLGAAVDFTNTLGGNSSTDAFRIDGLYRFNERHAVGLSWYRVGLSGNKAINQEIQVGDNIVSAGAATQTGLSFNTYRLLYSYSFYRSDKVELAFSPGLYIMKTNFNFAAQGTINGKASSTALVNEQVTLPLPSVGFVLNYNITPKLQFQNRYDFFYLTINDYSGAMFEFYAGLEYRLLKHFAMGAAYDRLQAGLRGDGDKGFTANFSYNLAYVYATIYLF
ncbi:MAG: hypothetical protein P0111_11320 [Nitrospira sp.]|nr:hypothetical protein [Nitrospira sp.]